MKYLNQLNSIAKIFDLEFKVPDERTPGMGAELQNGGDPCVSFRQADRQSHLKMHEIADEEELKSKLTSPEYPRCKNVNGSTYCFCS
ncbi:hypothetical protein [Methanolobus halotolerans]|uniref:Uncharacterized protein n=1 Tax=Methanolobus halotolerans TaxID=2052935 RepID=A0A4E0QS36_9EURY|nr:hypothetical protein [Methanolobus halotolerans]TGC09678.1 hypothetical protein CUN85_04760 [Methanolobus halotolerans]